MSVAHELYAYALFFMNFNNLLDKLYILSYNISITSIGGEHMNITYEELASLIDPAKIKQDNLGEVHGCPIGIGGDTLCENVSLPSEVKCRKCWNQRIPYTVVAEAKMNGCYGFQYHEGEKFQVTRVDRKYPVVYHPKFNTRVYIPIEDFKFYIDRN